MGEEKKGQSGDGAHLTRIDAKLREMKDRVGRDKLRAALEKLKWEIQQNLRAEASVKARVLATIDEILGDVGQPVFKADDTKMRLRRVAGDSRRSLKQEPRRMLPVMAALATIEREIDAILEEEGIERKQSE